MRPRTGFMLTLAGLATFLGCSKKETEHREDALASPETVVAEPEVKPVEEIVEEPVQEEAPEPLPSNIIEMVIKQYRETGDEDPIRRAATALAKRTPFTNYANEAFALNRALGDTAAMQRIARRNYIEHSCLLLERAEEMVRTAGLELNPELHNERGDFQFKGESYSEALDAYQKASNKEGVRKTAKKMEEKSHYRDDVFEAYLSIGDRDSAHRVAKREFIEEGRRGNRLLERLGMPVTQDMWNARGDHLMGQWHSRRRKEFDCFTIRFLQDAYSSYRTAGNEAKMKKITEIYKTELYREEIERVRKENSRQASQQ